MIRAVVIVAAALLVLTGCFRTTIDTTVSSDDTFSQHAVVAFDPSAAAQVGAQAGIDLSTVLDDVREDPAITELQERYPDRVVISDFTDGDLQGIEVTVTDLPLEEWDSAVATVPLMSESAGIDRRDGTFVVTMPALGGLPEMGMLPSGSLSLIESAVDVALTFTFPGPVTSASAGTIDGRSVTLTASDLLTATDAITIVADDTGGIDWAPILRWGLIALAFLLVIGGAAALVWQDRRARRGSSLPPPTTGSASGPGVLTPEPDQPAPPITDAAGGD